MTSPILAHFLLTLAAPNVTEAQYGEAVYQASHAVMVEEACMVYMTPDGGDMAEDMNVANWPNQVREAIAFAKKQGASLNPTYDQCLHLVVGVQRELNK